MRIKLSKKWIKYLISLPESGMGYQIVDIELKDGRIIKGVYVFNAEYLDLPNKYGSLKANDIKKIKLSNKWELRVEIKLQKE